jgi:hypothetical protein
MCHDDDKKAARQNLWRSFIAADAQRSNAEYLVGLVKVVPAAAGVSIQVSLHRFGAFVLGSFWKIVSSLQKHAHSYLKDYILMKSVFVLSFPCSRGPLSHAAEQALTG